MTHGDANSRRIRIRVEGNPARDLGALLRWLGREDWFTQAQREYGLKVAYCEEDGTERETRPEGPPMGGLITELVLVVTGAAMTPVFEDLYKRAKAAVRAWADNSGADMPQVAREGDGPRNAAGVPETGGADPGEAPAAAPHDGEGGRI